VFLANNFLLFCSKSLTDDPIAELVVTEQQKVRDNHSIGLFYNERVFAVQKHLNTLIPELRTTKLVKIRRCKNKKIPLLLNWFIKIMIIPDHLPTTFLQLNVLK
jgi:hypothetical protein